jgi:hypothetical protein
MPQFDQITFFNQIFWLILSFLSFYFIILKNYLPKLSASLKTRKKKLLLGAQANTSFSKEQLEVSDSLNTLVEASFADLRTKLAKTNEDGSQWLTFQTQGVSTLSSDLQKSSWSFATFNHYSSTALTLLTQQSINKSFIKNI